MSKGALELVKNHDDIYPTAASGGGKKDGTDGRGNIENPKETLFIVLDAQGSLRACTRDNASAKPLLKEHDGTFELSQQMQPKGRYSPIIANNPLDGLEKHALSFNEVREEEIVPNISRSIRERIERGVNLCILINGELRDDLDQRVIFDIIDMVRNNGGDVIAYAINNCGPLAHSVYAKANNQVTTKETIFTSESGSDISSPANQGFNSVLEDFADRFNYRQVVRAVNDGLAQVQTNCELWDPRLVDSLSNTTHEQFLALCRKRDAAYNNSIGLKSLEGYRYDWQIAAEKVGPVAAFWIEAWHSKSRITNVTSETDIADILEDNRIDDNIPLYDILTGIFKESTNLLPELNISRVDVNGKMRDIKKWCLDLADKHPTVKSAFLLTGSLIVVSISLLMIADIYRHGRITAFNNHVKPSNTNSTGNPLADPTKKLDIDSTAYDSTISSFTFVRNGITQRVPANSSNALTVVNPETLDALLSAIAQGQGDTPWDKQCQRQGNTVTCPPQTGSLFYVTKTDTAKVIGETETCLHVLVQSNMTAAGGLFVQMDPGNNAHITMLNARMQLATLESMHMQDNCITYVATGFNHAMPLLISTMDPIGDLIGNSLKPSIDILYDNTKGAPRIKEMNNFSVITPHNSNDIIFVTVKYPQ